MSSASTVAQWMSMTRMTSWIFVVSNNDADDDRGKSIAIQTPRLLQGCRGSHRTERATMKWNEKNSTSLFPVLFRRFSSAPSFERGFKAFERRYLIVLYSSRIYMYIHRYICIKKSEKKKHKKERTKIRRTTFYFRTTANDIGNNVQFFSTSRRASRSDKLRQCFSFKLLQPRLFRRYSHRFEQQYEIGLKKTDS